jgi:hypothetical protein
VNWFLTLSWAGKLFSVFVLGLFCGAAVVVFLVGEHTEAYLEQHGCPAEEQTENE